MIPIAEFQRRSQTGPVMREQQFDLAFSRKVREIVQRYNIQRDPEGIVPSDDVADRVFQAGVDLLAEVGLYNKDTVRVIQFDRAELAQIAREIRDGPRQQSFGRSKDEVVIKYRRPEDPTQLVIWMGPLIPSSEELYIPFMQSFAQEELAQGVYSAPLVSAGGVESVVGTPGEIITALAQIQYSREVARRVGKPDMFIGSSRAVSVGAIIAGFFPGGLEKHNSMIPIHLMPELKLGWSRLALAAYCQERGIIPWTSVSSIMGALCRGPEESAVSLVAGLLGELAFGHGTIGVVGAVELDGSHSRPGALWAYSAATMGAGRNIGLPMGGNTGSVAGVCTEMALYEKAAQMVTCVASGAAWMRGTSSRSGKGLNTTAGLEGRLVAETAHAVAGIKRGKANELIKRIQALYLEQLGAAPQGKTFAECYDLRTVTPTAEYLGVYHRAKDKLSQLGVNYQ